MSALPGVSLVVISYNRPRMLAEALASVRGQAVDQVVLCDDGSDFDPQPILDAALPEVENRLVIRSEPMSVSERLITPRVGRLLNFGLMHAAHEVVLYLCDDDLFAPGWAESARHFFDENPGEHVVRADWQAWQDGEPLDVAKPWIGDYRRMTTGNFAHRLSCVEDEGVRWSEHSVGIHDDFFLRSLDRVHPIRETAYLPVLAGYRRLHDTNMANHTTWPWDYTRTARAVLSRRFLD